MAFDRNEVRNIRPDSRFDTYVPKTDSQRDAMHTMKKLAQSLVDLQDVFKTSTNPFSKAAFFVLSGGPGLGKSHLLEALIHEVEESAPNVLDHMFLLRESFTLHTIGGVGSSTFDRRPIVLIDDLFSQHPSVDKLCPATDIKGLAQYIAYAYENRVVTIATCNFPFIDSILPKIKESDPVGRITSRCAEVITANSGELTMDGPDHRMLMAEEALKRKKANAGGSFPFLGIK